LTFVKRLLSRLQTPGPVWLIIFWVIVAVLYLPSWQGGFFLDFLDTLDLYERQSFTDFINREGINNKSLYQVTQILLYILISVFGHNPLPWFLLFTLLHALNAWIILRFFLRLFDRLDYSPGFTTSVIGVLLFLVHPVQADVLVWKAAFHYLTGILMIFAILHWTLSYIKQARRRYLFFILILYFVSSFTLEIFYLTPAFVVCLVCALYLSGSIDRGTARRTLLHIFLPLAGIWCLHLLTYYMVYGKWIAHYEVKMGESFTLRHALSRVAKYTVHLFGLEFTWSNGWRNKFYELSETTPALLITALLLPVTAIAGIAGWRRWTVRFRVVALLITMGLLSYVIILPMWFNDMQLMRNDRYYYLPSVFMLMLVSVLLHGIAHKGLRRLIAAICFCYCIVFTFRISLMTQQASRIFYGLIDSYRWYDASAVLLLNLPNNYEGIGMIPARGTYFADHLKVLGKGAPKGKVYDVSSYNVTDKWNGAHVTVLDSSRIKVRLNQWGSWWWWDGKGAQSYENSLYRVEITDPGAEYILYLKQQPDDMILLYQVGDSWKVVDRTLIGQEQW